MIKRKKVEWEGTKEGRRQEVKSKNKRKRVGRKKSRNVVRKEKRVRKKGLKKRLCEE